VVDMLSQMAFFHSTQTHITSTTSYTCEDTWSLPRAIKTTPSYVLHLRCIAHHSALAPISHLSSWPGRESNQRPRDARLSAITNGSQ